MTDAMWTAIPLIIGAIGLMWQNWLAHKKLNHITVLTNSTLTAANKRIETLEEVVRKLLMEKESKVE